jgi:hypothetical protein
MGHVTAAMRRSAVARATARAQVSPDYRTALAEVRANQAMLDGCEGPHEFERVDDAPKLFGRWRCSKCGGEIDNLARTWYARGFNHAVQAAAAPPAKA